MSPSRFILKFSHLRPFIDRSLRMPLAKILREVDQRHKVSLEGLRNRHSTRDGSTPAGCGKPSQYGHGIGCACCVGYARSRQAVRKELVRGLPTIPQEF